MFNEQLNKMKAKIVNYAFLVESMINKSIRGLKEKDKLLLKEVIKKDEKYANNIEMNIEKQCISIIAQYCPMALNLRTVLMILKMNNDMERMADHCVNISRACLFLIKNPFQTKLMNEIPVMADEVSKMLKDSITSFIENDAELAKNVCIRDKSINDFRDNILKNIIESMHKNPHAIQSLVQYMDISRNLERISDLSTNIAEDVVFMIEGKVIKHKKALE